MSNTFAPFGFRPVSTSNGPINWRVSTRRIKSDAAAIYKGDVVMPVTGTANGYITVGVPCTLSTTVRLLGLPVSFDDAEAHCLVPVLAGQRRDGRRYCLRD